MLRWTFEKAFLGMNRVPAYLVAKPHLCLLTNSSLLPSGGTIFVHTFGAYFGLAISLMVRHRNYNNITSSDFQVRPMFSIRVVPYRFAFRSVNKI